MSVFELMVSNVANVKKPSNFNELKVSQVCWQHLWTFKPKASLYFVMPCKNSPFPTNFLKTLNRLNRMMSMCLWSTPHMLNTFFRVVKIIQKKWQFMLLFYIIYTFLKSIVKPFCILSHVTKGFVCTFLGFSECDMILWNWSQCARSGMLPHM